MRRDELLPGKTRCRRHTAGRWGLTWGPKAVCLLPVWCAHRRAWATPCDQERLRRRVVSRSRRMARRLLLWRRRIREGGRGAGWSAYWPRPRRLRLLLPGRSDGQRTLAVGLCALPLLGRQLQWLGGGLRALLRPRREGWLGAHKPPLPRDLLLLLLLLLLLGGKDAVLACTQRLAGRRRRRFCLLLPGCSYGQGALSVGLCALPLLGRQLDLADGRHRLCRLPQRLLLMMMPPLLLLLLLCKSVGPSSSSCCVCCLRRLRLRLLLAGCSYGERTLAIGLCALPLLGSQLQRLGRRRRCRRDCWLGCSWRRGGPSLLLLLALRQQRLRRRRQGLHWGLLHSFLLRHGQRLQPRLLLLLRSPPGRMLHLLHMPRRLARQLAPPVPLVRLPAAQARAVGSVGRQRLLRDVHVVAIRVEGAAGMRCQAGGPPLVLRLCQALLLLLLRVPLRCCQHPVEGGRAGGGQRTTGGEGCGSSHSCRAGSNSCRRRRMLLLCRLLLPHCTCCRRQQRFRWRQAWGHHGCRWEQRG